MNGWTKASLSELGDLSRGKSKHRPRNDVSLYGGDYPFIQTGDVKEAIFYVNEYSQTYNEKGLKQSKLWEKDTLCITIAANIAESAMLKFPACFPDSIVGFIPHEGVSDVRFIKYLLDNYKAEFQKRSKGATQDNLSVSKINSLKVKVPNYKYQVRIADIISTYDNLIENNQKRIQILEEMAQRLYTEWFVNFKFPSHEKARIVDSGTEFGMIPEGWEIKDFYQVVNDFDSRRKPVSSLKRREMQGKFPYYGAAKVIDHVNNYLFDGRYLLIAEDGSVITKSGNPVLQLVDEKFWVSNHAHVVQGNILSTEMVYLRLSTYNIAPLMTGVAQPKITKKNLGRINFVIPANTILEKFDSIIIKYFDEIFLLKKQISYSIFARDLLRENLITGKRLLK